MVKERKNAQVWLRENYKFSQGVRRIKPHWKFVIIEGVLIVKDFYELEDLDLKSQYLTELKIVNCIKLLTFINCPNLVHLHAERNFLTELNLDKQIKLEILKISDNNFSPQTLSFISHLINLKQLFLGNYIKDPMSVKLEQRIKNGTYNRFFGSLKLLRNMKNLQILNIVNTDIDSGLEYLPVNLKSIYLLSEQKKEVRKESKTKKLIELLKDYQIIRRNFIHDEFQHERYDLNTWRQKNKILINSAIDSNKIFLKLRILNYLIWKDNKDKGQILTLKEKALSIVEFNYEMKLNELYNKLYNLEKNNEENIESQIQILPI